MVLIVVAGCVHCTEFAHADYLADFLSQRLPNFEYHRIAKEYVEWVDWLRLKNKEHGWSHWKSPLIWRDTAMRGGLAELVGGLHDFSEYCHEYYGICSFLSQDEKKLLVEENIKEKEREKIVQRLWEKERLSYENQAAAVIVGAASAGRTLGILVAELLSVKTVKKVILWEEDEKKRLFLEKEMEENWHLGPVVLLESLKGALYTACLVIVLQFPDPRVDPQSVVALTADPELLPQLRSTRWSLQPAVWGWPGVAHLLDTSGAKVGAAWREPARRALGKIPRSSLPQGKWRAEIRTARCVPEVQQRTAGPHQDYSKKSKSHHHLSLATVRAIMNVVHLWLDDFGFPPEEIISLGIFSDGTHNLPKGLVFSQPATLDCSGFWSPCETVHPPPGGLVGIPDILVIPLRATASFGLGRCMRAIWTLPTRERENLLEKEKVAAEHIPVEEESVKAWLEMYALLDRCEERVSTEIERKAVSAEAKYRWLSLSERLPEDKMMEHEYTSFASGLINSLLNTDEIPYVHKEESVAFMEDVD